ncbi:hypothetical protein ACH4E7_10135 [Kitasatospora sp. NPDC018058]|uniref:hypothetical protein n=1 Tax=Kitasatospora sp. NPDC018058 TaxID=3364025 RepID=UPI0037C147F8
MIPVMRFAGENDTTTRCIERTAEVQPLCKATQTVWDAGFATTKRAEPGPAVRDFVRLSDAWTGRPDLYEAVMAGYGRRLSAAEEEHLAVHRVLDAVSGIQYGAANGDPELVERPPHPGPAARHPPSVTTRTTNRPEEQHVAYALEEWEQHYAGGRGFRPLGDSERAFLAEHTPVPSMTEGVVLIRRDVFEQVGGWNVLPDPRKGRAR